ncbi:MAG: CheR family methyltransferase [Prolixibacteraceae bacterium]
MITERYGIKMPPEKKIMFQARLQRRLRELKLTSFETYAEKLFENNGNSDEFRILADFISTNKTDFFREQNHFDFLTNHVLIEFFQHARLHLNPFLNFWSAGCSSGQEAYSIAITLEEFRKKSNLNLDYSITATDISARMLKKAKEAIYAMDQVSDISLEIKHKYFLKSKSATDSTVRVVKEIRDRVSFSYLNLMNQSYPYVNKFDVVFLRNTLIYFDSKTQRFVLTRVLESLKPGGYLIIGHSESLINMDLPIKSVAPSVYVKITADFN